MFQGFTLSTMARRKHAAWSAQFDHALMVQFQSGITDIHWHKYAKDFSTLQWNHFYVKSRFDDQEPVVFGLWHVGVQFGFWMLGIVFALLVFCIERAK